MARRKRVLSVEDWAEIRRLRRSERLSISEIARVLGISRNTVKSALASDEPPKNQRAAAGSVADAAEPRIRQSLSAYPRMPATVIAERIDWSIRSEPSVRRCGWGSPSPMSSSTPNTLRVSVIVFLIRSATVSGPGRRWSPRRRTMLVRRSNT